MTDHPSRETRNLCLLDGWLRAHGFRIHARPKSGPAEWRRGGVVYEQRLAVDVADAEAVAAAGKCPAAQAAGGR